MRRILNSAVLVSAVCGAVLFGCSDDKKSPTDSNTTGLPPIMVLGEFDLYDGTLTGNIDLWDVSTSGVRIDSVHAGDYWHVTRSDHDWDDNRYWVGEDNWYTLGFYDDTVTTYASGDTLLVQLFAGNDVATLRLRLLDGAEDTIFGISEPSGPLALNSTPQFTWSDVSSADLYSVDIRVVIPIGGGFIRFYMGSWAQVDTTFTVPAEYTAYDGSTLNFSVTAQSGPMPTAKGAFTPNIVSSTFRGAIWSSGGGYYASYPVGSVVLTSDNEVPDKPTSYQVLKKMVVGQ